MDVGQPAHGPEDEADGAERAFEALREEVAALRRGVELVYRQAQQTPAVPEAPDYSPTLGAIAKELRTVGKRLETIERTPVLAVAPSAQAAELRGQLYQAVEEARRGFAHSQGRLDDTMRELRGLIGSARAWRDQKQWLWTVGAIGVMGGALLWFMLVAMLPWGAGTWLAALPLGGRCQAGETLIQEADPTTWARMVGLYKACPQGTATELCEAAIAVKTSSPGQPLSGAEGTSPGQSATSPRSKTGR